LKIPKDAETLPIIRIIDGGNDLASSITICAQKFKIEQYPKNDSYENLLKAYSLSSQSGISLMHYIIENSEGAM